MNRRVCTRCGKEVHVSVRGRMVAHQCPHGRACLLSYAQRRHTKSQRCPECFAACQIPLPLAGLE